jgi:hypothetical protein
MKGGILKIFGYVDGNVRSFGHRYLIPAGALAMQIDALVLAV